MKANSFPALVIFTVVTGILVLAFGGGFGGALIGMVISFVLVGWFGPKALVVGLLAGCWAAFVGILKAINPMNEKW
jgi:hypothetical protein